MQNKSRRNLAALLVAILILLLFLLVRCNRSKPVPGIPGSAPSESPAASAAEPAKTSPETPVPDERLTPATLQAPPQVAAGAAFSVAWTGPDNDQDYVTIVRKGTRDASHAAYALTRSGSPAKLTAPLEAGECEVRYVTARSKTVLARAAVAILPTEATLDAAAEATLDSPINVSWTGPDNAGDYITIVAKDLPNAQHGNYALTNKHSPVTLTTPPALGEMELRYVTGQGGKVLARRPIRLVMPEVSLSAPTEGIAGAAVVVTWSGPGHDGDYITVVKQDAPDGQYGNYSTVSKKSPVNVTLLMDPGAFELRYMTGRGAKVLARRPIQIIAAEVALDAPAESPAGAGINVTWKGPANAGDYLTIVPHGAPDSRHDNYVMIGKISPLQVKALKEPGEAELRYVSGQGARVLARRPITLTP